MYIFNQQNHVLIFLGAGFFAILALTFILFYGVNLPFWDDWNFVNIVVAAYDGEKFWEEKHFFNYVAHRFIIPHLILISIGLFFSWNLIYAMLFGWFFLIGSIVFLYFLIKEHNPQFKWLIIPISAILFSPLQYENFLWAHTSLAWFLTMCSITASIYFLNKKKTSLPFAVTFAVIASFSTLLGLLIWPVGVISLFRKTKSMTIWLSCMTVVFITYFFNYFSEKERVVDGILVKIISPRIQFETLFTKDAYEYILLYLSNGLETNLYFLQLLSGVLILIVILTTIVWSFKKFRNDKNRLVPWIQFGLIGIFAAIMTELGRIGLRWGVPDTSRYITMSNFSLIAFIVIITIIIFGLGWQKKNIQRSIASVFLIFVIILSSSYYQGWIEGSNWHEARTMDLECITDSSREFKCPNVFWRAEELVESATQLKERNLGPFN